MLIDSFAGVPVPPIGALRGLNDGPAGASPIGAAILGSRSRHLTLFDPGAEIFGPGTEARYLFQVEFGAARVCSLLNDGRRTISAFHFPGEIFGFEPGGHHRFRAEAVASLGLRTLAAPEEGAAAAELLRIALDRLTQAQEHLLVVGRQTAIERIAAFLVDVAARQHQPETIDLPMPHGDIADYLGLTPETVCRVFKHLREDGLVDFSSCRRVTVKSAGALARLIG